MFDEQLIAERTGHSSLAIRKYKRTSDEQIKEVSDALQPPKPKFPMQLTPEATTVTTKPVIDLSNATISPENNNSQINICITKGDIKFELGL